MSEKLAVARARAWEEADAAYEQYRRCTMNVAVHRQAWQRAYLAAVRYGPREMISLADQPEPKGDTP